MMRRRARWSLSPSPEAAELAALLAPVASRVAAGAAVRWLARAVTAVASGLLAWALVTAFVPVPFPLRQLVTWLAPLLAIGALAGARWYRPDVVLAARLADRRAHLADRLGTAVELLARPARPSGLARLQVREALTAAAALDPRTVAPVRLPAGAWRALAVCLLLVAWARFGAGFAVPGTPAGRMAATIHREGRALVDIARRLDETGRAGRLPEALRAAPAVQDAGRRLEAPRVGWDDAMGQVRDVVRRLQAAQDTVRRRIDEAMPRAGLRAGSRTPAPDDREARAADQAQRLEAARLALQDLAGALRDGAGNGMSPEELARRLRALSESLDQLGAPPGVRAGVERARRAAESGQRGASSAALGDALQDLQGLERMLGDEQALGDARRQAQRSAERIARASRAGGAAEPAGESGPETSRQASSGPNPVVPGTDETASPPPGPNQGSLAGRGTGGNLGTPTPRLGGTRAQSRLQGLPGTGSSHVREIAGPGRAGSAQHAAGSPPADVAHEIDRALSQDPLPPVYVTLVRRYFDTSGGTP